MPSRGGLVVGDDDSKRRSQLYTRAYESEKKTILRRSKEQDDILSVELLDGYTGLIYLENHYYGFLLHPWNWSIGKLFCKKKNCITNFNLIYNLYCVIIIIIIFIHHSFSSQ